MKIEQIIYFVKIAQTRSITRASEQLHISQPAISVALFDLENEFGVKLFNRSRSGTVLTEAGQRLLPEAEKILVDWENLKVKANIETSYLKGGLIMGAVPSICSTFIPRLIEIFKKDFPQIDLSLHSGGSNRIFKDVGEGKFQLGIISWMKEKAFPHATYVMDRLFDSSVYAIANAAFRERLASDEVTLKTLSQFHLLTFTADYGAYNNLNDRLRSECPTGSLTFVESHQLLLELCVNGMGIGFLPSFLARKNVYVEQGRLWPIKVNELGIDREIGIIRLKNTPLSIPVRRLIGMAQDLAKDYQGIE